MNNYYLTHEKRIMREIKLAIPHYRRFVLDAYGANLAGVTVDETIERFATLLPQLPYIGGDGNRLTKNLYLSAVMLALYQTLKSRGKPLDEIARIIYQGTNSLYSSFPFNILLRFQGWRVLGHGYRERLRRESAISQIRQYPDDWVFNLVEGDGQKILFGVDYTECGIVKYLTGQGAPELAPYLCWLDYPMCAAMRVGLVRTETIAQGNRKCNFRFCRWQDHIEVKPNFMQN